MLDHTLGSAPVFPTGKGKEGEEEQHSLIPTLSLSRNSSAAPVAPRFMDHPQMCTGKREQREKFGNSDPDLCKERASIPFFLSLLLGEERGMLDPKEVAVIPIHPAAFHDFRGGIPASFVHPTFLWRSGFGCGQAKGKKFPPASFSHY